MVDYLEECRTINDAYHAEELRYLRYEIVKKRRGKVTQDFTIAGKCTSPHLSLLWLLRLKATLRSFPIPRISLDIAPSDLSVSKSEN